MNDTFEKKDLLLLTTKLTEKIPDPCNAKEDYQPKAFQKPNIFYLKSVFTGRPKTSHKLSKIIRQAEKEGSNSSLYSYTKNVKNF